MSPLLSILFALQLGLVSGFNFSVTSSNQEISFNKLGETACPLNFDALRKLVRERAPRPSLLDMSTQCQHILDGIRLVRSEYLRTSGYFLPPLATAKSCWDLYRVLVSEFVEGFDIRLSCGYHPEWISETCMNITSQFQFESLIPKSKLQKIRQFCYQSLDNNSQCSLCTDILSNLGESYLHHGNEISNASDCTGYPFMYAAAFVNQFGPTDISTAKCLFSLKFSSRDSRTSQHVVVISGIVIGSGIAAAFVNQFGPTDISTAKCLFSLKFSSRDSRTSQHVVVISGIVIGSGIGVLGASVVVWLLWFLHKKSVNEKKPSFAKTTSSLDLELGSVGGRSNLVKFKFVDVKQATGNFSRENLVGMGGYGNVYKGILSSDGSEGSFAHEVEVIASVRHTNLVCLRGYCTETVAMEGHQRIIVYDLMQNGSLHDNLFTPASAEAKKKNLSWPIRKKIAFGTARGLAYLHNGVQPAIIHRDVKSSNILLDEKFEPKLADFGFAKFTSDDGKTHLTTRVAGTLGYVAPEYALYGQLTEKSDVYSFGVVLLELLSGKKAIIYKKEGQNSLLTDWAWSRVKEGRIMDVVDKGMPELESLEVMEQYALIAVICCHPVLQARPTMDQVLKMLETVLAVPNIS